MPELAAETPRQIIGIVGDVRGDGLDNDPGPTMYVPNAQVPDALNALNVRITPLKWVVRTRVNPFTLSSAIQEQLRQASGLPVSDVRTMDEVVSRSTSRQRFNMLLMTVFGAAALFLAALGVYGLMAYSVQQRTQEIGIRMALGAGSGHVLKMVVWQGMRLALVGVVDRHRLGPRTESLAGHFPVRREAKGSRRLHRRAADPHPRILDRRLAAGTPRCPRGSVDRAAHRVSVTCCAESAFAAIVKKIPDMPVYRSRTTTHGRNMAGARSLWRATGMKDGDFGKPIVAVANSFTQFVPGHVHLKDLGQLVAGEIEQAGGVAKEFNTIAVDDGIAMGHGGMLYSLPSRELIADSVEYMANAHCADALVCISNCDKITPGMLMAALRLNIPAIFVSGGPMEAGKVQQGDLVRSVDLVDAMIAAADPRVSDEFSGQMERSACPTCGSCSGMFTANSMNCLTEALGLALPGNGTIVATHADRKRLFAEAGRRIVDLARRYYEQDDAGILPRGIATFDAFENAMALDIAMGGSTNTVLHLLAAAHEAEVPFTMRDMDRLSRRVPHLCKVAPSSPTVHVEDVHRAGGVFGILAELDRGGLLHRGARTVHAATLGDAIEQWDVRNGAAEAVREFYRAAPGGVRTTEPFSQSRRYCEPRSGPRRRRDPRRGARVQQRRRPGRAVRQYRRGWLHREDGGRGRREPHLHRAGAHLRKPGRCRRRHSRRPRAARRSRGDPLRRAEGRTRHAGDAVSHQLPEIQGPREGVRAGHGRAVFGRKLRPLDRPRVAGSGRGRSARTGGRWRPHRDRYSKAQHPSGRERCGIGAAACRDGIARRGGVEAGVAAARGVQGIAGVRRDGYQRRARRGPGVIARQASWPACFR